eukprot:scaffold37019_cov19-Prasinocladus_malaysianus.AAC.1
MPHVCPCAVFKKCIQNLAELSNGTNKLHIRILHFSSKTSTESAQYKFGGYMRVADHSDGIDFLALRAITVGAVLQNPSHVPQLC